MFVSHNHKCRAALVTVFCSKKTANCAFSSRAHRLHQGARSVLAKHRAGLSYTHTKCNSIYAHYKSAASLRHSHSVIFIGISYTEFHLNGTQLVYITTKIPLAPSGKMSLTLHRCLETHCVETSCVAFHPNRSVHT